MCKRENYTYFQNSISNKDSLVNYAPIFKTDDLLDIQVSSSNIEASAPFNLPRTLTTINNSYTNGTPVIQGYLVDSDGNINFPFLGKIKIAGKNRFEAMEQIQTLLIPYLNQPIVQIRIANFKITILGDVTRPGTYTIPNDRITILGSTWSCWGFKYNRN